MFKLTACNKQNFMLQTIGDNVNKTFVITFSREWNKADANHMYDSDLQELL